MSEVTQILSKVASGDPRASDELLPFVYEELRKLAAARMANEQPDHTLQATALVHEAYIRLVGDVPQSWDSRGHFFAASAEAMRRILIERARQKRSQKGGGNVRRNGETRGGSAKPIPERANRPLGPGHRREPRQRRSDPARSARG